MFSNHTSQRTIKEIQGEPIIICNEFLLHRCFYKGKSHNLYFAIRNSTQNQQYVVKLSSKDERLINEEKSIKKLLEINASVPVILFSGEQKFKHNYYHYQVMLRYGPSMKLCFQILEQSFTQSLIALMAIQTLTALEKIHRNFIIHRNLKPKKILTLLDNQNEVVIYDYRFAKKFKIKKGVSVQNQENNKLQNKQFLNKFSSLNMHLGITSSPKDDLESLAYIIFYFLNKGNFLKISETMQLKKWKKLETFKLNFIPEKQLHQIPIEFIAYYNAVKISNLTDYPMQDYDIYKKLFRQFLSRIGINEKDIIIPWGQFNKCQNLPQMKEKNLKSKFRNTAVEDSAMKEQMFEEIVDLSESELDENDMMDQANLETRISRLTNETKSNFDNYSKTECCVQTNSLTPLFNKSTQCVFQIKQLDC